MHASGFECVFENCFSYFTSKTYVVDTQKDHLHELKLMDKNLYLTYKRAFSDHLSSSGYGLTYVIKRGS